MFRLARPLTASIRAYSTNAPSKKLIYTSPNVGLIKLMKRFSLTTFGASSLSTPAIMYFWESPAVQATGLTGTMFLGESISRYVLTQLVMIAVAASACSTGALHFLLSPYINNIYLLTNNEEKATITPNTQIAIETLDFLTRKRTTVLRLRDLSPISGSSFLTWKVNKSILEKQYALEQAKGIEPKIVQTKFWLDQTNGTGDRDTMINILRLVHEQGRQRSL